MNYQNQYNKIIEKSKSENRKKLKRNDISYVYYENHHILPKCLDGGEEKENKVLLTAKEHFVCHKLLTYIYKGNRRIAYAFHRITYCKNRNYIKSLRDYAYAIELIKTTTVSRETRNKLSKAAKGKSKSIEHRKKIGEALKGKFKNPWSNETRNKMIKYWENRRKPKIKKPKYIYLL